MKKYYVFFMLLPSIMANAQDLSHAKQANQVKSLTLKQCQEAAEQQYPLTKKRELIAKTSEYSLENISKGYLPQFAVYGQATYQSDVTKVPVNIPGAQIPEQNKDQYKVYLEMTQLLYDGGALKQQKKTQSSLKNTEAQKLEVELYNLKDRINNLYFGVLIINEQQKQNELRREDIKIGLKTVEAQITNGTSFRSNADLLKAELLKTDQQMITLKNNKKSYLQMLGLFIDSELDEHTVLERPEIPLAGNSINRPELLFYNSLTENLELEKKSINATNRPKLSLFSQSGIGNPGLNMFEEGFKGYFITGIRLNWSLSGFYTQKKQKAIIDLNKLDAEAQKETFLFNTNQQLKQQESEISKLQEYLTIDSGIVTLRANIKKASLAQLQNGVITTSDYLREVNEENLALQNKSIHDIELLLSQYREIITRGLER